MPTPKYPTRNATAKTGVNYVRSIVEGSNSIFTEIHQENDIGIDALIEFIKNEHPTGKCIGVQIKSGDSFYDEKRNECVIPVDNHADYWTHYPLPVFGIVYVPMRKCGFWVNIKDYLRGNRQSATIRFQCTRVNTFENANFNRIFVPNIIGELPDEFPYEEALELFHSPNQDESNLGLYILFRLHSDRNDVWDEFIAYFRNQSSENIPGVFAYYLAHIPWHGDIAGGRDKITKESKEYARSLLASFTKADVVKLLCLIDENGISRGTVGQSVEAIISVIQDSCVCLADIAQDNDLPLPIKEFAALIFTYYSQNTVQGLQESMALWQRIAGQSQYANELIAYLREYHGIALY